MIEFDEHASEGRSIDLTPMIDVVFLLLIFFLLTSIFARPSIPLDLPEAETAQNERSPDIAVAIRKDGGVHFEGRNVSLPELRSALEQAYRKSNDGKISLVSDKGVPFGKVVEVMDVAKSAGAERISVIAERKE
jgi:biopolymer transport protein ExbD